MVRDNAPAVTGDMPIVTNLRGDRAFNRQTGHIVCPEVPFLQRVLVFALAAAAFGGIVPARAAVNAPAKPAVARPRPSAKPMARPVVAAKPAAPGFHFRHRSVWAVKWAAQHPAEEAAYQRSMMRKYAHPAIHRWTAWRWHYGMPYATGHSRFVAKRAGSAWFGRVAPASVRVPSRLSAAPQRAAGAVSGDSAGGVRVAFAPPASERIRTIPSVPALPLGGSQPAAFPAKKASSQRVAAVDSRKVADNTGASPEAVSSVSLDFVGADINDVIKSLAMQTHTNIVSGADVKGNITVSLTDVSLDEALDMITKLSGFGYAKVGRTYVVGTPASIQALTTSGTASVAPVTAVLTLSYSDLAQMQTSIKDRYPNVKVTTGSTVGNVSAGGVLIVTGTDDDITGVKALVDASETALAHGMATAKTVLYHIKYSSAIDLMAVLSRLVPSLVVTPAPCPGFQLTAPTTADAGGATTTTAQYGTGGSTGGGASTSTSSNGSSTTSSSTVAVKPGVNGLLLTGSDTDISRANDILAEVDVKPAQISYDAKITEVNLGKTRNIGLNWDLSGAKTRIGELPDQTGGSTLLPSDSSKNLIKFGVISRTPINDIANVGLDAVFNDNSTKVLADPNISAVDGQQAAVFIGDTVEYVSSITQTTTGPTVTTASVNVGIKLYVAGKVSSDGYVTVNIHPEVSTISSWLNVPGGGQLPQISSREATTTVRVKDGDYIAIGGLINEDDVKSVQKVPGLGDLPFFGSLFRDNQTSKTRDEIVIFVKVSIQKDAA